MAQEHPDGNVAYYADLCRRIRQRYASALLPFPPVTETQLQQTEERIGFRLPSLLRFLYKEFANGGFGPGYPGLLGIAGGCSIGYPYPRPSDAPYSQRSESLGFTLEDCIVHSDWQLDEETERMLTQYPATFALARDHEPDGTMMLCDVGGSDIGWGGAYYLNLHNGHIYRIWVYSASTPAAHEKSQIISESVLLPGQQSCLLGLQYMASSLDELLEDWLKVFGTHSLNELRYTPVPKRTSVRQSMTWRCIGLVGAHGITSLSDLDDKGKAFVDDEPPFEAEDFLESEDWDWYQQQPALEIDTD